MTKQEVFNKMILGLLEQGKPSYNHEKQCCQYIMPDGCKCIVGHAIEDPELAKNMDRSKNTPIGCLMSFQPKSNPRTKKLLGIFDDFKLSFLSNLQNIHDEYVLHHVREYTEKSITPDDFRKYIIDGVNSLLEDNPDEGLVMPDLSKYEAKV